MAQLMTSSQFIIKTPSKQVEIIYNLNLDT